MKEVHESGRFSRGVYRVIRGLVRLFYPKTRIVGAEHLPEGGCIVVGNHTQMNGPIVSELYFPGTRKIWCAWQMMYRKEVPAYAYQDFWSAKPKRIRWFYKILSYVIAPFSVCVFNNAHTIAVYHDTRILSTFRQTVDELAGGTRVIIFPECGKKHNHIINQFQDRYIDIARLYQKKTGKPLAFVPMYVAPKLKAAYLGEPVVYDPKARPEEERERISSYLMDAVTDIAVHLPRHIVVPYDNVGRRAYGTNVPGEGAP